MAMLGTKENPVEGGSYHRGNGTGYRTKLPHGWLVMDAFVPNAEDGTGWGKNDPADLENI